MPDKEQAGGAGGLWLLIPILIAAIYVLSLGPAALLCERMGWDAAPFRGFYAPLLWLHDNTQPRAPLEWYEALWVGR
jgi:hypothetical protein